MIDLQTLTPGVYKIVDGKPVFVPAAKPKRRKSRCRIVEPEKTLAVRKDFRRGMSWRALAKKHTLAIGTIRRCLRGDLYVTMIAEAEGLEPTLAAVCLVGERAHLQPANARACLDDYYDRGTIDGYDRDAVHDLNPEQRKRRVKFEGKRVKTRRVGRHAPGRKGKVT